MQRLSTLLLLFVVVGNGMSAPLLQDSLDCGVNDTLALTVGALPCAAEGRTQFQVTLHCFNDSNLIRAIGAGFAWDNPNVVLDSAVTTDLGASSFNYICGLYRKGNRDSSNFYRLCEIFGASLMGAGVPPSSSRHSLATYYFSANSWSTRDSIVIDTQQFNAGTNFVFVGENRAKYAPIWAGKLTVYDAQRQCCVGSRGNVDADVNGLVDLADITCLLGYVYGDQPTLICPEAANVDGSADGLVNVFDVLVLLDYLICGGEPPPPCNAGN